MCVCVSAILENPCMNVSVCVRVSKRAYVHDTHTQAYDDCDNSVDDRYRRRSFYCCVRALHAKRETQALQLKYC